MRSGIYERAKPPKGGGAKLKSLKPLRKQKVRLSVDAYAKFAI